MKKIDAKRRAVCKRMRERNGRRIFYGLFLFSLVFSAVLLARTRGAGLHAFLYEDATELFSDFINNLHYPTHDGGPYFDSIWATFPPLAYTLYYLCNVALTRAVYPFEILAYTVITSLTCMLLLYGVQRLFARRCRRAYRSGEPALLSLCLLLSGVMIYTIERGNSVLNVMVMLLLALELRDSREAWKREAALLLIAVAAGFKIYPCVFGLLYVFEKRWKETVRLLIYGVALFFVPFAWFSGAEGFKQFLYNHQEIQTMVRDDYLTSIPSVLGFIGAEAGWPAQKVSLLSKVLSLLAGAAMLSCICLEKRLWLRTLLMVSLFTLVPGWNAEYMAVYMILPFVLCYLDAGEEKAFPVYMALFACVFILLPFGADLGWHKQTSWNMLVSFGAIYGLTLIGMADTVVAFARRRAVAKA